MSQAKTRTKSSEAPVNVKLLLIGNSSVGKSSLLLRFSDEQFLPEDEANATVGVDFSVHKMRVNSRKIKLIMHYVGISYDISFPSNYVIGLVDNASTRTWSE